MPDTFSQDNIDRFDDVAATWDDKPRRIELAHAVAAAIKNHIPLSRDMEALELGCGTGLVTLELAPALKSIVAIDSSEEMLNVLQQKIAALGATNVRVQRMDLGRETPGQAVHLVYSSMTVHHIQDVSGLLQTFHKILQPDGWLAIADLDQEDGTFHEDPTGVAHPGFERDDFRDLLRQHGFGEVQFFDAHTIHKETEDGGNKDFSVFLAVARKASP